MRDIIIVLGSTILFFLVVILSLIGIQKDIFRLPVYYNPNGLVVNVNAEFKKFWGHKLDLEDLQYAKDLNEKFSFAEHEVRIYDKNQNVQTGRFFFRNINKTNIIKLFWVDILMSLCAFVVGIWFFYYIRDLFIFFFFLGASSLILSNFFYLAFSGYYFLLIFSLYHTSFSLFNLSFRFRGKEIQSKWLIPQLILSFLAGFIVQTELDNRSIIINVGYGGLFLILFSVLVTITSILYDILRYDQQGNILKRKMSLVISLSIIFTIPVSLLLDDPFQFLNFHRSIFLGFFILFLISFIYGTYRYSLVPVQIFFNPSIINIFLVGFYLSLYSLFVFFLNPYITLPLFQNTHYFNFLFLTVSVVYFIQAKTLIRNMVNYYSFDKDGKLKDSLKEISRLISSPISMKMVVGTMNRHMMEALNVNKIVLLIPGDQFANTDLKNINFTRISKNSDIWKYFSGSNEITVTSHLSYGVGFRENLYNYLFGMGIQIAYPIRDLSNKSNNKAILLVGEKKSKQNFSLGELRYIREICRLASMLIDNYSLLADEIEKKKIIRKLHTASVLDHTLNLIDNVNYDRLKIGYISIPAVEVSGDYLDIIQLDQNRVGIFLGDVSGHGLGTAYIVTAIKAMVRDMIQSDYKLEDIFESINLFLKEKYDGNEFMTLLGGILDTRLEVFTQINAGHPGPILLSADKKVIPYNKTQRVLGILETKYTTTEIPIHLNDKLVIYSDGITETFGDSERIFGEEALNAFLKNNLNRSAIELPSILKSELDAFRDGEEMTDDTTFVAVELVSEDKNTDNKE